MTGVVHAAAQGWFESLRLAWGAWLSSPGAGILAAVGAVGAGWFAYRGVQRRIDGDRSLAQEARSAEAVKDREHDARERAKDRKVDARNRWWEAHNHLWDNRLLLPGEAVTLGVESLEKLVTTKEQAAMLTVFSKYIERLADEGEW